MLDIISITTLDIMICTMLNTTLNIILSTMSIIMISTILKQNIKAKKINYDYLMFNCVRKYQWFTFIYNN